MRCSTRKTKTTNRLVAGFALLTVLAMCGSAQAAVAKIYFTQGNLTNNDLIWSMNADGSGQTTVTTSVWTYGIALDEANNKLYFPNHNFEVRSVNTNGTGLTTLQSTSQRNRGVAVDEVGGNVYFTQDFAHILKSPLSSWSSTLYAQANTNFVWDVDVDSANGYLYSMAGSSISNNMEFRRAPLSNPSSYTVLNANIGSNGGGALALDVANGLVYFAGGSIGVEKANLDGTGLTTIIAPPGGNSFIESIALDPDAQQLYIGRRDFIPSNFSRVLRMDTDGTNQVALFSSPLYWGISGIDLELAEAVPEPSTYALGLIGLAGLGMLAWRRKRGS